MTSTTRIDLSVHHQPKGASDRIAFGFTKALRFAGRQPNVATPELAKRYWNLGPDATLRDVVLAVRADEAGHRDVNHGFANELAGDPIAHVAGQDIAPASLRNAA